MFRPMRRRRYGFASPWREMERFQREMNQLLSETFGESRPSYAPDFPAINVWANQDGAVVTAELPGVNPEDIDVTIVGQTLTISGSREPEDLGEDVKLHRQERGFGKFTRSFELPFLVDDAKVEAVFEKGVLHLSLPRAEADKPKKIAVKTA